MVQMLKYVYPYSTSAIYRLKSILLFHVKSSHGQYCKFWFWLENSNIFTVFFLNRTKSMHFFCQSVLESKSSFSALARISYLNASRDLVRKWFWKWVKVTVYLEYCTTFTAAPPAVSVLAPTDVLFLLLSPTYQVQFQQLSSWHFRTESQSRSKSRNCLGKSNPFSAIQFTTPTLL